MLLTLQGGGIFQRVGWDGAAPSGYSAAKVVDTAGNVFVLIGDFARFKYTGLGNVGTDWVFQLAFASSCILLAGLFAASRDRMGFAAGAGAPLVVILAALLLVGFIPSATVNGHLLVLWPFVPLAVGSALSQVRLRFPSAALSLLAFLLLAELAFALHCHADLARTGGTGRASQQIYSLAEFLSDNPGLKPVAMGKGISFEVYYLSGGKVDADSLGASAAGRDDARFERKLLTEMRDPDKVYIFYAQGTENAEAYSRFAEICASQNKTAELVKVFSERDGSPAFRLYAVG
jgi:hypothetical protein